MVLAVRTAGAEGNSRIPPSMARVGRFLDSRGALVTGAAALVAVALVIALRGVAAPWWVHADPYGAYVARA
jgi:hypothetical protein